LLRSGTRSMPDRSLKIESFALLSSVRSALVIERLTTRVASMFNASILVTPDRMDAACA
jgi:hypothetical protein